MKAIDQAKVFMAQAEAGKAKVIFAHDVVVANEISEKAVTKVVKVENIPADMMGVDAGPETIKIIKDIIKNAGTVIWNGPVGVFEIPKFAKGTKR
jgi:phosphoglycerate kinase